MSEDQIRDARSDEWFTVPVVRSIGNSAELITKVHPNAMQQKALDDAMRVHNARTAIVTATWNLLAKLGTREHPVEPWYAAEFEACEEAMIRLTDLEEGLM